MTYAVCLNAFEGPLDLLISLIKKNKIDIWDIPISTITNQYLKQIRTWQDMDMEITGEFVVMAARLLEIKAKSLLPKNEQDEEDAEDLQAKLVRQLMEYKIFKEISRYLSGREKVELCAVYRDPEYIPQNTIRAPLQLDPSLLQHAFLQILSRKEAGDEMESVAPPQKIVRDLYSIEEKIIEITDRLVEAGQSGVRFSELLQPNISREEVVVILLSLLEMVKTTGLRLLQNRVFIDFQIQREVEEK